jgi:NAD(P)H-dependent FMN reductase
MLGTTVRPSGYGPGISLVHTVDHSGVSEEKPVLLVVVASTRPGRVGLPVARWFEQVARDHGGFAVEVADLADIDLPLLDEPHHPRLRRYVHDHTRRWSATVERADAVVFVTPEYNHSYPGALKNAVDFLSQEWRHKPVGIVSYGGVSAGLRAVQALKLVLGALAMVPVPEGVPIPFVTQHLSGEGDDRIFTPNDVIETGAKTMLDALVSWMPAVRGFRTP